MRWLLFPEKGKVVYINIQQLSSIHFQVYSIYPRSVLDIKFPSETIMNKAVKLPDILYSLNQFSSHICFTYIESC